MVKATREVKKFLAISGKKGGLATKQKHGVDFFKKIGKKGGSKKATSKLN